MTRVFLLLLAALLTACGGGDDPQGASSASRVKLLAQQPATRISTVPGERRAYSFVWSKGKLTGAAKTAALSNFELSASEVRLPDISLNFDAESSTGQLYRLYQAAFGRVPDVAGLGYWKDGLEKHGLTLSQVATAFLNSPESRTRYGVDSDDATFIQRLYKNVLNRQPDAGGNSYWLGALKGGGGRIDVLLSFVDSAENKTATAEAIAKGIAFAEPGVAYIPVASATAPTDVLVGATVVLDGSPSTDANGDALRYNWTMSARPIGSVAVLDNPVAAQPKVKLDKSGSYEFTLWVSDAVSQSYSPAKLVVVAHTTILDSGLYTCMGVDWDTAQSLYSNGHAYLDRDKDGIACDAADIAFEKSPPVPTVLDTGTYRCSDISHQTAVLLYLQGHTYLDRDHDGKPCEQTDINTERVTYPPSNPSPSSGMCWVNGYTKKNGTHVSGYYRRC